MNRREFIAGAASAALTGCTTGAATVFAPKDERLYGMLLHLGMNMWSNRPMGTPSFVKPKYEPPKEYFEKYGEVHRRNQELKGLADGMRFEEPMWREVTGRMRDLGMNFCMIDIGEGLVYPSHPELAVKGSWSIEKMRAELKRLRTMGLEPIPKLNFSTTHDAWLGVYERMVSTKKYYEVVADVIRDVCEIFDTPRFFHLGFDEEDYDHQDDYVHCVVRQGELWWHDFLYAVKEVEKHGVRPWIWADKIWHHREEFVRRMPKSVLQSNWYYLGDFNPDEKSALYPMVHAYDWLEAAGYDQVPCVSNVGYWHLQGYNNPKLTVDYCRSVAKVAPERFKGLMMAPWQATMAYTRPFFDQAFEYMPAAKRAMDAWPAT